jgi:uncharacterized SAM-binding protein YcdF (DUF218 family)
MKGLRVWSFRGFAAIGVVLSVITFTPVLRWWAVALAGEWKDPRGDVLIVLGAGMLGPELLDAGSHWRAIYGSAAWKEGFGTVVISGRGVAGPMKKLMVLYGVPETAITVENGSVSTRENAVMTAELLRSVAGAKVLLTSDYHMYRAARCFRAAGLQIHPRPFPDALKRMQDPVQRWPVFRDLMVETAKIGWYEWRGWM